MLFNSFIFIILFLPIFIIFYFVVNKFNFEYGRILIIIAGLIFYYSAGFKSFSIFITSSFLNYLFAYLIKRCCKIKKILLIVSISFNVLFLLYYKFISFILTSSLINLSFTFNDFTIPLGFSFFTFQQIMYLISVFKDDIKDIKIVDYFAYITYFPKLIMGPLVEPEYLINQFNDTSLKQINYDNLAIGLKLFSFGLFKKVILADTFIKGVNWGFTNFESTTPMDIILIMLFYTFEIYFDFSGYSDMSIGISKMINIDLPINFDSPYKAISIRDFWKRWHISLTNFFTKYIYFPLGGNKKGNIRTYLNILIVFLISGIWHGANFTFILWGALYGIIQIFERILNKFYIKLPLFIRWLYTFITVNLLWLLFRSPSITQWLNMILRIFISKTISISNGLLNSFSSPEVSLVYKLFQISENSIFVKHLNLLFFTIVGFFICLVPNNNYQSKNKITKINLFMSVFAFIWAFLCLSNESVFVYLIFRSITI